MSKPTLDIRLGARIPLAIGTVVEIQLLELLGTGAFGSVWKVADIATNRIYALKIIQGIESGTLLAERVKAEAEVSIPSEHVVRALGLHQWDRSTYLLLFEYFPGTPLNVILAKYRLSQDQKKEIFRQVLLGVADAHRCNIIHRDLKPGNIMVDDRGKVKLIDFGISKFQHKHLTQDREFMGTLPYIAPELIVHGGQIADARTDIYSLGHILYEMATGQRFWSQKGWRELEDLVRYFNRIPPPTEGIELSDFDNDLYPNLATVLAKMTKVEPIYRCSSIHEVMRELGYSFKIPELPKDLHLRYPLLVVESGSNRGARTLVNLPDRGTLVLGRTDLAGADDSISRRHVEFSRSGDRYFVRDLNSKNGTLLLGIALFPEGAPVPIMHGDRLKVGDVFLQFVFSPKG
jgi:eukaryotic-like serine/threonine-protein kinase